MTGHSFFLFNAFLQSTPSGAISKSGDESGLGEKSSNDDSPACPRGGAGSAIVSQPSGREVDQSANGVAIFEPSGVVRPGQ